MPRASRACLAILAALIALLAGPLSAAAQDAPAQDPGPPLWIVQDEDTTIYLFGAIAILPAGTEWQSAPVSEAFAQSDELVLEMRDPETDEAMRAFTTHGSLDGNRTAREIMPPDLRRDFDAWVARQPQPAATFDRLRPWVIASTVSSTPFLAMELDEENAPFPLLLSRAQERGMTVGHLETLDDQYRVFSSLSREDELAFLQTVLDFESDIMANFDGLVAAWLAGDLESLDALMQAQEMPERLRNAIMIHRNRKWSGWIERRLDSPGTVFLAVTAAHFAGDDSVISILEARDIAVSRIQ